MQHAAMQKFFKDVKRGGLAILERGTIQSTSFHNLQENEIEWELLVPEQMTIDWIVDNNLEEDLLPYPNCPQ